MDIAADIRNQFRNGHVIMKIILVNVLVFLAQSLLLLIFYFAGSKNLYLHFLSNWLWVSDDLHRLITRPWTLFTYMFMHDPQDILHILSNMLYLYFFGRIFVEFIRPVNGLPLYLTGGIVGALVAIAAHNFIPTLSAQPAVPMVGGSAAVMAIVLATATLAPNYTVFMLFIGPVKIKYIALLVVVIDLLSIPQENNLGGHLAHLGGALTGYLYIRADQKGRNWFDWWPRFEQSVTGIFERKKPRIVYVRNTPSGPDQQRQSKGFDADKQRKLDAILDKIKAGGYDSLTKAEKDFLFKISNEK